MQYFDKIYVICTDKNCVRHEKGYWRSDIQNKIQLLQQKYSHTRKRYNNFRSHLKAINNAKNTNFDNVLILEDDVRPVAKHTFTRKDLTQIIKKLAHQKWDVIRLASYPRLFSIYHRHKKCSKECKCRAITPRMCEIKGFCDMRNTEAYAVHRRAFSKFPFSYNGSLWFDQWINRVNLTQLYIMPQVFVQQIKQGDLYTTEIFKKKCFK